MANKKTTEPRVSEEIAERRNRLPDNITWELWDNNEIVGLVKELEVHRFSVDAPALNAFTGMIIIETISKEMDLTSRYRMRVRCGSEYLNSYKFQFVGEDPNPRVLSEPDIPLVSCPVINGQEYEFFAREK